MTSDFWQAFLFGLIPLFVALALKILQKVYPLALESNNISPLSNDEFQRWYRFAAFSAILFTALGGALFYVLFVFVARIYFATILAGVDLLRLPEIAFGLPALFLGIVTSVLPTEVLMRKRLQGSYEQYCKACDVKFKINSRVLGRHLQIIFVPICVLAFFYILWCTSRIQGEELHIHRFGNLSSQRYRLSAVTKIILSKRLKAPNGNFVFRSNYRIVFSDSSTWQIDDEGDGPPFIRAVSEKTGLPIVDEETD